MNDVQHLVDIAAQLKRQGQAQEALEAYSKAFDALVDESGVYARNKVGADIAVEDLRSKAPELIEYSKIYLKQDVAAASILNEMGNLFAALGEYDNAKQKYNEAIELIPNDVAFDEPMNNLGLLPVQSGVEIIREQSSEE